MTYRALREFVRQLEKAGELKRITVEVDPVLEITEGIARVLPDELQCQLNLTRRCLRGGDESRA